MEILDAQVHAWDRDGAQFPWHLDFGSSELDQQGAAHFEAQTMPPDRLLGSMDAAGVDAAVVVSPTLYAADTSYVRYTVSLDPARLAFVGLVDPLSPTLVGDVAAWRAQPGALAIRISVYLDHVMESLVSGPLRDVLAAAERHDVPVCVYPPGYLAPLEKVVRSFPRLQFVVDHLGVAQPAPVFPALEGDRFERLPELLRLAEYSNVAVKATGLPSLSSESYPFHDVWDPLRRVVDAFGCERVMWGTDFTRVAELATYAEGVAYLRELDFSESDLELLYGRTLRTVLRW